VVEPETVRALLETIEHRLSRLTSMREVQRGEFEKNHDLQDIVERNFEVLIQACIDLGLHLLADHARPIPETNRAVFAALQAEGIVTPDLAPELAKMAGFRNLLARGYARLVPEQVHAHLGRLDDVRAYVEQVHHYLQRPGAA